MIRIPQLPVQRLLKSRFGLYFLFLTFCIGVFTTLRIAFLFWSWSSIDWSIGTLPYIFGVGLIYDFAYCAYFSLVFVPVLWLLPNRLFGSKIIKGLAFAAFSFCVFFILFSSVGEVLFWNEFGVRLNFISVDYLVYSQEVVDNIVESYPIVWIFGGIATIAVGFVYLMRRYILRSLEAKESFGSRSAYAGSLVAASAFAYLLVGQPLHTLSENNYENELASNGPYQFVAAFRNNTLDYRNFYAQGDDAKLSEWLKASVGNVRDEGSGLYDIRREVLNGGRLGGAQNVILVSVESLSADFMERFGNEEGITPFLDSLAKDSLFFSNFYATGTRTTRGLEAITLSMPPTPGRSLVKRPDNAGCYSLGKVFDDHGYDTRFLYGGRGFFDNMNAFFSGNGYGIVDQNDFAENEVRFVNAWGVCDEDLFAKAQRLADEDFEAGKPFFFHIMTTSNHRPYTYPEGVIDIPSGTGRSGAVKYADYALKELIEGSKDRDWFKDTVFVIVADHCAGSAGKIGLPVEKYHIPLFVYAPGRIEAREIDSLSSQIDLGPTLLSLLGMDYESCFFGKDILAANFKERALIGNYQKLGYYEEGQLAILSPQSRIEIVDNPLSSEARIHEVASGAIPVVEKAMAYYQGADFVLRQRMNRVESERPILGVATSSAKPFDPAGSWRSGKHSLGDVSESSVSSRGLGDTFPTQ